MSTVESANHSNGEDLNEDAIDFSALSYCAFNIWHGDGCVTTASGPHHGYRRIFFKAKDPKALAAWYRDVLGMPVEAWGGAALRYDAPKHPRALAWNAFPATTKYFAPSTSGLMINYAVDDMDAMLARLKSHDVKVLKRDDSDANGRFAWILDPEGNKVELWEPKR